MTRTPDVLPGTLELLILRTLQKMRSTGHRQVAVEAREWERMANAVGRVMKFA